MASFHIDALWEYSQDATSSRGHHGHNIPDYYHQPSHRHHFHHRCHRSHRDCQHCIIRIIMIVIRGAALDSAMGALSSLTWFMFTHASCGDLPSPLSAIFEQDACRSPAVARAVIHRASRDARLTRIDIIDPQSSRKSFLLRVSPSTGISSAKQDVLGQYSLCKKLLAFFLTVCRI